MASIMVLAAPQVATAIPCAFSSSVSRRTKRSDPVHRNFRGVCQRDGGDSFETVRPFCIPSLPLRPLPVRRTASYPDKYGDFCW
jgi:hypothetical protein